MTTQLSVACQAVPPSRVPAKRVVSPRGPGRSALPATPRRVTRAWGPPQEGMYEAATVAGPLARKLLFVKCPSISC